MHKLVLEVRGFKVSLDQVDSNYVIAAPDYKFTTPNKAMAAKKLGDAIFQVLDLLDSRVPVNAVPLEQAVIPYVDELEKACQENGDAVLAEEGWACACMGPHNNEPLCPCAMHQKAREIVSKRRGYTSSPQLLED